MRETPTSQELAQRIYNLVVRSRISERDSVLQEIELTLLRKYEQGVERGERSAATTYARIIDSRTELHPTGEGPGWPWLEDVPRDLT